MRPSSSGFWALPVRRSPFRTPGLRHNLANDRQPATGYPFDWSVLCHRSIPALVRGRETWKRGGKDSRWTREARAVVGGQWWWSVVGDGIKSMFQGSRTKILLGLFKLRSRLVVTVVFALTVCLTVSAFPLRLGRNSPHAPHNPEHPPLQDLHDRSSESQHGLISTNLRASTTADGSTPSRI